jgi:hypothetical protein
VADVVDGTCPAATIAVTLDANEHFTDVEPFRAYWERLSAEPALAAFLGRVVFVEQPLHRSAALGDDVRAAFAAWPASRR